MLITGPWQEASSNYSCLFDQISVPASLIQPGVLRCYCPGKTGLSGLAFAHPLVLPPGLNWKHRVLYLPGISVVIFCLCSSVEIVSLATEKFQEEEYNVPMRSTGG